MHANMNFRMRRRYCDECDVPHPLPLKVNVTKKKKKKKKKNKAEFTKSASTMICKIILCSHLKSIGLLTALVFFS